VAAQFMEIVQMHDVVDSYSPSPKPGEELENSLRRLEARMDRERYLEATEAAHQILQSRAVKNPALAEKQARLLAVLKRR
jgi:hypothetical protein